MDPFSLDDALIEPGSVALYSASQPRASNGRWTTGGGGFGGDVAERRGGMELLPKSVQAQLAKQGVKVAPSAPRPAPKPPAPAAVTKPAPAPKPAPKPKPETPEGEMTPTAKKALDRAEARIRNNDLETAVVIDPKTGRVVLDKSEGRKDAVSFTEAETAKMRGMTLTHNHPSSSSFSPDDFALASRHGLAEIRAIGRNGYSHSIKPGVKGWPPDNWRSAILGGWQSEHDTLFPGYRSRVMRGEISADRAWQSHSHEIWTNLARTYPDYLQYNRTYDAKHDVSAVKPRSRRSA